MLVRILPFETLIEQTKLLSSPVLDTTSIRRRTSNFPGDFVQGINLPMWGEALEIEAFCYRRTKVKFGSSFSDRPA